MTDDDHPRTAPITQQPADLPRRRLDDVVIPPETGYRQPAPLDWSPTAWAEAGEPDYDDQDGWDRALGDGALERSVDPVEVHARRRLWRLIVIAAVLGLIAWGSVCLVIVRWSVTSLLGSW